MKSTEVKTSDVTTKPKKTTPSDVDSSKELEENKDKNYILAVALSFLVGSLGVDRFYLGYKLTGVLKLLTLGGLGFWTIIDLWLIVFGKLKAKDSKLPLEAYGKYSKPLKMTAVVLVIVNILTFIAMMTFVGFSIMQMQTVQKDNQTYQNAQAVANEIETYIINERTIPNSLEEVAPGFDTAGLTFHKDSEAAYTFCAAYKHDGTAGDGTPDIYAPETYKDTAHLFISSQHKAGQNCRTIKPVIIAEPAALVQPQSSTSNVIPASERSTAGCGVTGVTSPSSTGTVAKLSRSSQPTNGVADFTFTIPARNGGTTYDVPASAHVFDSNCAPKNHEDVVEGDSVLVFAKLEDGTHVTGETLPALAVVDLTRH